MGPPLDAALARSCERWARTALARDALPRLLATTGRAPSLVAGLELVAARAQAVNGASEALRRLVGMANPGDRALVAARVGDVLVALDDLAAACALACASNPVWYEGPGEAGP